MSVVYRKLGMKSATEIMDWCENNGVDYDIWNAEAMVEGLETEIELGLPEWVWERFAV